MTLADTNKAYTGVTLSEILISLAILGVISAFTIPKILQATSPGERRHAVAQEVLGTLAGMENGICFAGDITCKVNPGTGTAQDGKPTVSNPGDDAYDQFIAYLDVHLNYAKKDPNGGQPLYLLHNQTVITLDRLIVTTYNPSVYDVAAEFTVAFDRTVTQALANEFSLGGVDTNVAEIWVFRNGTTMGGRNNRNLKIGSGYVPVNASIYDYPEHPNDLCSVVGGTNCPYAGWYAIGVCD